jgi:hypothetical protein
VRSYKRDLDRNRSVVHEIQRELASRTYRLTEVRILDLLIWSVSAAPERPAVARAARWDEVGRRGGTRGHVVS